MNTLIIHPSDRTTDFLEDIYSRLDATVIRGDVSRGFLIKQIEAADRVYMLGHGVPQGLLGFYKLMLDETYVPYLRGKELVGVWCNADSFFRRHDLTGLYTGMIISEPLEAKVFNIDATADEINQSNAKLAASIRDSLEVFEPLYAAEQVVEFYTEPGRFYVSKKDNPVIEYNKNNIYSTCQIMDQPMPDWVDVVDEGYGPTTGSQ